MEWDRSPWGPWTDYGRPLCAAEESANAIIDQILTDGGMLLWQKYLERKAFTFAATAISEALVSRLRMCYVHHDSGEPGRPDEGWEIEEEPEPGEIDSWARMHLPVRRLARGDEGGPSTSTKSSRFMSSRRNPGSRGRPNSKGAKEQEKKEVPRSVPLESDHPMDVEEERLREAKAQEESRRRDKERKAKESEKTKEQERLKVQQLHKEMSERAHTFDTEGNLIWVDDNFKPDRLPRLQEAFGYAVKKDPRARQADQDMKSTMGSTGMAPGTPEDSRKKGAKKRGKQRQAAKKAEVEPEFTDGFSKLQHGQPPILETMVVQPGVMLESVGKRKAGPEVDQGSRYMSRKEYVQLAEREVAMDGGYRPNFNNSGSVGQNASTMSDGNAVSFAGGEGGGPGAVGPDGKPLPPGATLGPGQLAAAEAAGKQGGGLPNIAGGRGRPPGAGGGPASPGAGGIAGEKGSAPAQKAPPAPPPFTRNRKFEALGFVRPPRYHVPQLGGPQGFGSPQPPLGATMGHGLIKSGSHKEAYFFPPSAPELPLHLLRSSSDGALGSGRGSRRTPRLSPKPGQEKGDDGIGDDEAGGRLRAEMSPAYRNFRHALMPAENILAPGTTSGYSGSIRR
mmetsp:Transcript_85910/g.152178  ORF Transcript_85910/g.152178 Transcript_85910/m.152178 type:complete len:620 (+) Transcript_85910:93-1952(+)